LKELRKGYLERVTIEDISRIFFSDMHTFFTKVQYLQFARGFPEDRRFNKKELVVLLRAMLGGNGILKMRACMRQPPRLHAPMPPWKNNAELRSQKDGFTQSQGLKAQF
jgi:hypothetical protein